MELWSYRPTPKQLAMTVVCFVTGASLFAVGAHLSLAPKQARTNTKARNDFHQTTPQKDDIINSLDFRVHSQRGTTNKTETGYMEGALVKVGTEMRE
ncbi:hypothetical protein L1049_021627 [Liquidambar formosana]|uniref:Uncharacterized protein n=1 Tax=Liquidambar formosana TaxID=63359 RepID=A0AAP0N7X1_LIQFO